MHVTSSSVVTLSEMSLKKQKSVLKIIFSNFKTNLHDEGFTGFDDVIIVFVTSQPQNIYFTKFNKKLCQPTKNLIFIAYPSIFR